MSETKPWMCRFGMHNEASVGRATRRTSSVTPIPNSRFRHVTRCTDAHLVCIACGRERHDLSDFSDIVEEL